jgi:hypothetical protein
MPAARQVPCLGDEDGPAVGHGVTAGDRVARQFIREEAGVAQAQRLQQQLLHRRLVRLPGHHLDRAAGDVDRDVVVLELRAGRRPLRQPAQVGDVVRQRVVAAAEVLLVIAGPAGAVV